MALGGEELWGYDLEAGAWTLYRVDPHPGYRVGSGVVHDSERSAALLVGGEAYDADRRFVG